MKKLVRGNEIISNKLTKSAKTRHATACHRYKMSTYDKAKQSADFLLASTKYRPKIAVICGTGLGALSDLVENPDYFPYEAIPNFPACTAPGHAGKMVFGRLRGVDVVLMKGRFHMYEGHDMATVHFKQ